MWIDPLLDFTRTVLPAENVPETSWTHSLPCARYNRGLGLCATAAQRKPAAKITIASWKFFFIVGRFLVLSIWYLAKTSLSYRSFTERTLIQSRLRPPQKAKY
jgi:hypothetical protein